MTDCMIDVESWGTRPGCAIRSIGACIFDPRGEGVTESFYANIDDDPCEAIGLTRDASTVAWWEQQSAAARDVFAENPLPITHALRAFIMWWEGQGAIRPWSHGANFDQPLLEAAFVAAGYPGAPWKFWDSRCTRTLYGLAGVSPKSIRFIGTEHNALDDAVHQAKVAQLAMRKLGLAPTLVQQMTDAGVLG